MKTALRILQMPSAVEEAYSKEIGHHEGLPNWPIRRARSDCTFAWRFTTIKQHRHSILLWRIDPVPRPQQIDSNHPLLAVLAHEKTTRALQHHLLRD